MDSGHQALEDAVVVVDNLFQATMTFRNSEEGHLGKWCQAVGGAGCVGDDLHVLVVASLVHSHHEHGRVSRGGGDDHLREHQLDFWPGSLATVKVFDVHLLANLLSTTLVMKSSLL